MAREVGPDEIRHSSKGSALLKRGETELSIDTSGLQRFLPKFLRFAFADVEAEKAYRIAYESEKRRDFTILVAILFYVNIVQLSLLGYSDAGVDSSQRRSAVLIAHSVTLIVTKVAGKICSHPSAGPRTWFVLPLIMWLIEATHIICDLWFYPVPRLAADSVSWVLLYTYTIYVIFPLRFRYCCLLALSLNLLHLALLVTSPTPQQLFPNQLVSNLVLYITVNILGTMSFFFYEKQQRRAFLETCQSLEAKLVLEEESQKQERLLLSVLPKHVAGEIRSDLGAVVTGQFKKIYMSRHENVSILFADIVGFTAISSTCPAADLVRTLNELFARFDKLAEKYHQLRIKILGDCYYCISGAPEERPDHAVLCVHMGLSMVEAIKSVREQTKSPVDMRVGVHTGAVLAGVMGQKQWQFDVYSKDVELANKMESGGVPGMVHISEKTYSFLNDEFEVKDGDGASREEAIRLAGIKTYLIVKVLKQWPQGTLDADKKKTSEPRSSLADETTALTAPGSTGDGSNAGDIEEIIGPNGEILNFEEYHRRLLHELLNRESEQRMKEHISACSLQFTTDNFEHQWRCTRDVTSCISLLSLPITLLACLFSYFLLLGTQISLLPSLILVLSNGILLTMAVISCAPSLCSSAPKPFASISQAVQERSWIRLVIATSMITVWIAAHVVANLFCYDQTVDSSDDNITIATSSPSSSSSLSSSSSFSDAPSSSLYSLPLATSDSSSLPQSHFLSVDGSCNLPPFLTHFAVLGMIAITVLTRISYIVKTALILSLMVIQICLNLLPLQPSFRWYDTRLYSITVSIGHELTLSVILLTTAVVFILINRQFELMSRRLFLWKKQVEQQKEKVGDMRIKNEALVYNILPPHVAVHFLGKKKKDEELYSKSYDCVGVMFAAMPNFSDFYTEESVNNQGLECLRFLNEVISDYDALLEQARFKDIIKIKTIGPTYMAASGLNDEDAPPPDAPNTTKWAHLAQLTEFALALKETLTNINKESFNNFVLRIGLNQGPITAGVIGARKPHYDVWGNTVNVASRMESTGKAGSIQVVQETKDLLEEFGYTFEQRGMVSVKGKGMLRTFYLISGPNNPP